MKMMYNVVVWDTKLDEIHVIYENVSWERYHEIVNLYPTENNFSIVVDSI